MGGPSGRGDLLQPSMDRDLYACIVPKPSTGIAEVTSGMPLDERNAVSA